ncbi:hypothetical protein KBC75_01800 [Candidatus Shapirobacteria bacterium]|nr:hypothetical protein [Candidatus Shapirobacteria bacterium]
MPKTISSACPQGNKGLELELASGCLGGQFGTRDHSDVAFCICSRCEAPIPRDGRLIGIREDVPNNLPIVHRRVIYNLAEIIK